MKRTTFAILAATSLFAGCREPLKDSNWHEPNYLFAHSLELSQDVELQKTLTESESLLTDWFGTTDSPKIPPALDKSEYKELISIDNLKKAVGDTKSLYTLHCTSCHGNSGQGRGAAAASQDPYPRDFRAGVFKFKSSHRSAKPLKTDLVRTLRQGLSGTQMPVFNQLSDDEINALVDYVVYLSLRGEFEKRIYTLAATGELDDKESLKSQESSLADVLTEIADKWVEASDAVEEFELPDFPIYGTETDDNREALQASIAKGKALFATQTAACSKCHGELANGQGTQQPDYDDWTKEWTSKINFSPTDLDALAPLMARGGMKPLTLKPRNIVEGHLRGGREPINLYRKIRYGIAGTPMPAAAQAASSGETGLSNDDTWHIVNYVLSIAKIPPALPLPAEKKVAMNSN